MLARLVSLNPVLLNEWIVQASILNNTNICIILNNISTNETLINFFTDENKAHNFVTDVICGELDNAE